MTRRDPIRTLINEKKNAVITEHEKQTSALAAKNRGELPAWQYDNLKRESDASIARLKVEIADLERELADLDAAPDGDDGPAGGDPDGTKPYVFISYERSSEADATELEKRLVAEGFRVWQDVKMIRHTDQWPLAINAALNYTDRIIVLLTPQSMLSREVFNEWFFFYDERNPIHCLMLQTCQPHYQLRPFQWLDWRDPSKRDWARLFRELSGEFAYAVPDIVIVSRDAPARTRDEAFEALRVAVTGKDRSVALNQAQIDEIVRHKPQTDQQQRLQRIAEWSLPRYALDNRFVKLTLRLDKGRDSGEPERETLVDKTFTDLREILDERRDDAALILLGEPGAGKSTLLRRLQLDDAIDRLKDGGNRLSLFVSLNNYRPETDTAPLPSPREWLNAVWKREYPALESFDALLKEGRMLLLLDALNELPHTSDEEYKHRVELWQTFLVTMHADSRKNRAIITCRTRDYAVMLGTKEFPVPRIDIQRMSDAQVQDFLTVYIPDKAANIWAELAGTRQLDLFRTPYYLNLLCQQVERHGGIPDGRAALFTGFVRETLYRELEGKNPLLQPNGLLDTEDCQQVQLYEWNYAYELPEGGCLIERLSHFAYTAQERGSGSDGAQVRLREGDALKLIDHKQDRAIVRAGVDLTVLDKVGRDVLFFHQLLQEFFAARKLALTPNPDLIRREWRADAVSPSLSETLATIGDSDPLPPLPTTGWEQTALLAAAMTGDPDAFIRGLIDADLPTAARCAAQPDVKASDGLKADLGRRLIARTQDAAADLRHRIDAGLALGELGDPRFERRTGPHGDYLFPPLVTIPAGSYPIGDDDSPYDNEKPAHAVDLATFDIGMFPVTNAEYALFIGANGYEDEQWWDTAQARTWLHELSNDQERAQLRKHREDLQHVLSDQQIRDLVHRRVITSVEADGYFFIKNLTNNQFDDWLNETWPSGKTYREPKYRHNTRFNNPAQPVVGVTWYEAHAYCRWLSLQSAQRFELPSEVQFEAAARGKLGNSYPYGDQFNPRRSNTFESHIRRTTPVGIFDNRSFCGAYDLAGNASAWTRTIHSYSDDKFWYPYRAFDGREDLDSRDARIVRGGAWSQMFHGTRVVARDYSNIDYRADYIGFRLVHHPYSLKHTEQ